ncbi:SAM-dependent methyltransferase [Streptomyces sp. HF10]|uniref:SAM-dependent methyltransferase n=1 Tax=Streptomyces sp. HF10 TaxID=2692233 RepID=UPI00131933D7|nr:SAM-dependent methyltransferase [Streptomyces sp. HF10]QHC32412.1 hypothetical protein GR129_30095 [Streptomyces sp. HF10]
MAARLMEAPAPGSCPGLSMTTGDFEPENAAKGVAAHAVGGDALVARSRAEVGVFFKGLEPLEPGVVPVAEWRPGEGPDGDRPVSLYGGVARTAAD